MLKFSGHETFVCKHYWPKKGVDFLLAENSFNDKDAVIKLGVGKNMVSSIRFWLRALGLTDVDDNISKLGYKLFGKEGHDPYLEYIGTIWLLHYYLIKVNYASIYNLIFNEFRKERSVFNKSQIKSFIKRKYSETGNNSLNLNTIVKDISVFFRLYGKVDYQNVSKNFEDEISSLMIELELISSTVEDNIKEGTNKREKIEWFHLHGENRSSLPSSILLFSILDNFPDSKNIALKRLEIEPNGPSLVFVLSKNELYKKLKEIEAEYEGIIVSETAGNIVLVIPEGINKWKVLKKYYEN